MGTAIAASVLYADGVTEHIEDITQLGKVNDQGRIELEYAYGPHLLPQAQPSNEGMWRYISLLPLQEQQRLYPFPAGGTPLHLLPSLREYAKYPALWIKDETHSVTGSNKDRATALVLEQALRQKIHTVSCASTGNVALSLAVGAAASALKAVVFVPMNVTEAKLRLMLFAGAVVFKVEGGYDAAIKLSRSAATKFGWYDRNTGYNPLTLEAKKTVALEIWEQLGRQVPDVVVVPVGDGVTLSGIAKGFRELELCGATKKQPRLIGVQASGCQPLKATWENSGQIEPILTETIADGIAVPEPINRAMALRDVSRSGGGFVTVTDEEIMHAMRILAIKGGILAEPAGAAAFAALQTAQEQRLLFLTETIVVLVTGTGLKYSLPSSTFPMNAVYQVQANLTAVQRVLENEVEF